MKPTPEQYATLEKIQRATRTKEEHKRIKKCGTVVKESNDGC